ncbi:MAG: hypothetical protein DHS20C21_05640 [Gemmatimonadota bacterium]|nr:MAG: hypothetical protein DHS20C21_05640 [Gemmatimonadota bacterium]
MSDVPFHATRMGQRFYGRTPPELVLQIERLNELLKKVVGNRTDGMSGASGTSSQSNGPPEHPLGWRNCFTTMVTGGAFSRSSDRLMPQPVARLDVTKRTR